jgi:DNA polymerase III subunit epsilon
VLPKPWLWWRRRPAADDRRWVVIDVESSGLDVERDHLLAVAGVALRVSPAAQPTLDLSDSFEVLVRPPEATRAPDKANILIHGLGVEQQRCGLTPAQALAAFEAWAGTAPRLGYHVEFDRALIERAQRRLAGGGALPAARWLDIEPLVSLVSPGSGRQGLKTLDDALEHFGIVNAARHEAAADALATAELLLALWPALRREGVHDFAGAQALVAARRWLGR